MSWRARAGGHSQSESGILWGVLPHTREATLPVPERPSATDLARLPIGMFDSGIGGLTVLHECLVALPAEDFIYFGDTARFPYGPRTQGELLEFSKQIATLLDDIGVKLIVVACFSATAAALPALQERFETPVVGIVTPGARAAVQSSRYRRIGVMATEATVDSRAYVRAIGGLDAGAEVFQQSCPGLAAFIQDGDVFSPELVETVRGFTSPLKERRPDVVIMGCTHYPLIAPMLQRHLGRDVTLVNPAAEIAVEVEAILHRQGITRDGDREGEYRFLCTGDVEGFRSVGARFLQMPLERVEQVSLERLCARPAAARRTAAPTP
jgi:glutamate racemase